jgi:hypothetical protein
MWFRDGDQGVGVDVLAAAGRAIGRGLTASMPLRGSHRTRVVRAEVDGGPATVIVKSYEPGFTDRWAAESTALTLLRGRGLSVPDLIAVVDDPPLVVMEDVGDGPSLADALLGDCAATATARLHAWVDALAGLHVATVGDASRFATVLRLRDSAVDSTPDLLAGAADLLSEGLPALGVVPDERALTELRSASVALDRAALALTPADACPDNNVSTSSGLVLLDFEQATVRHVAWDAAYLVLPWPSCWCSWNLPADIAETALARWRAAVAPGLPVVGSAAFDRDLDIVVTAWAFMSSAWFLAGAVREGPQPPIGQSRGPGPTRRAVIRYRMRLAAQRRAARPALADLAEAVLAATVGPWGDLPLDHAPAYRR